MGLNTASMLFMPFVAWATSALTWTYCHIQWQCVCLDIRQHLRAPLLRVTRADVHMVNGHRLSSWHALGICGLWAVACAVQPPASRLILAAIHRSRVDTLSDKDSVPGGDVVLAGREEVIAAQSVVASLRRPCSCSAAKRRRGRDHGVVACCLHTFQKPGLLQRLIDQRLQRQQLHKLDHPRARSCKVLHGPRAACLWRRFYAAVGRLEHSHPGRLQHCG